MPQVDYGTILVQSSNRHPSKIGARIDGRSSRWKKSVSKLDREISEQDTGLSCGKALASQDHQGDTSYVAEVGLNAGCWRSVQPSQAYLGIRHALAPIMGQEIPIMHGEALTVDLSANWAGLSSWFGISHLNQGFFGLLGSIPQSRKMETAHIDNVNTMQMEAVKSVSVRDIVGSEFCVSSNSGKRVYNTVKSAISQGKKVRLSFENIKSLSAAFLDSAIGQLYNGEVQGNVDEKLSFENISPGRKLIVDRAIREAKEYYSDPERYIARMKEIFADDRCD